MQNNPYSYYLDKENGIPIKTFKEEKTDKELIKMIGILEKLANVSDVRDYIKDFVSNNQINFEKAKDIFNNVKTVKDKVRITDNKILKILSVEKVSNQVRPIKQVAKPVETKNAIYTSFRASNYIQTKNSKVLVPNKSQQNNISYNKHNDSI